MRYIKIKSDSMQEMGGDSFKLRAKEPLALGQKLSILRFPLKLRGEINMVGIRYELDEVLAEAGVLLLGAKHDGDEVTATLMCIGKTSSVKVKKGEPVLTAKLYEKVLFVKERK